MTHVFVAPHPDDVALSCGGLIAGLRELGQNIAILTVFSGDGAAGGLSPYQREALGFGSKSIWPVTEAFNRSHILNDYPAHPDPDDTLPPWQATTDRLDATQTDADAAAKRFWQRSSWYRRAEIHNTPLAGEPLMDDQPNQGAVMTDELMDQAAAGEVMATRRLEDERYALTPRRRSCSWTCPTPCSAATRATTSSWAGHGTTTRHRSSSSGARSPASSPRRCTCPSASAITSTTS